MKQAPNSLLTLYPIPTTAKPCALGLSRIEPEVNGRYFSFFCVHRKSPFNLYSLSGRSCPPRIRFCYRLGEGRIRSLLRAFCPGFLAACLALMSAYAACADQQETSLQEKTQSVSQGRPVAVKEIKPLLIDYLLKSTPWKESEIEVRSIEGLKGIDVPQGDIHFTVLSGTGVAGRSSMLVLMEAVQDGKGVRSFWITAAIRIHAEIVSAAKRIPQGKRLTSDELVRTALEIPDLHAGYFRDFEDVAGRVSRRALSPGDPIIRENLSDPFLIRSGETVQLRLVRNGIVLASTVRAEQNGRLGQVIKVRNLEFSSILKARVTGRAEVSIE